MTATAAKPGRMTPKMRQVLRDIVEGRGPYHGCHGRSEHGGRTGTLVGLYRRGLITARDEATELGRELIRPAVAGGG